MRIIANTIVKLISNYRSIFLFLLLLSLIFLGYWGRSSSLFEFPFNARVWGTASDWAMIAVTAITAYFLWKTLTKQIIITNLEQKRFLNSYLPIFEISNIVYTNIDSLSKTKFDLTLKNNYLQNLKITHNFPNDYKVTIPYYINDVILPTEYHFSFEISYQLSPVFIEIIEYTGNVLIFNFEDALGNKYEQLIVFKGSNNVFVHPAYRVTN